MIEFFRLLSKPGLLFYRMHSCIHSAPRERAAFQALSQLLQEGLRIGRIVDYGCGMGTLMPIAKKLGLPYLGLDIDDSALEFCEVAFGAEENVKFRHLARGCSFEDSDAVIFNGVLHHLDDAQLTEAIASIRNVRAIIVLDHAKVPEVRGPISLLQHLLQSFDQGKFVRPYSYYQSLDGLEAVSQREFAIRFVGIPLWPYFCITFRPKVQCAS